VIGCSALGCLEKLLQHASEAIKKESCWTISNITAGSKEQIQAVIDANIIPPLVEVLTKADFKTRKEVCLNIEYYQCYIFRHAGQLRILSVVALLNRFVM